MATRAKVVSFRENAKDRMRVNGPYMTPEQACRQIDLAFKQHIDPDYSVPDEEEERKKRVERMAETVAQRHSLDTGSGGT